jgi:predicted nucleotidyltransferase
LLTGGQWAYRHFSQEKPLADTLQSDPAVQEATVNQISGGLEVKVLLEPGVDLPRVYRQVQEDVHRLYSREPVRLIIEDHRSAALENLWRESQFAVYEAAAAGNFTSMAAAILELADRAAVDSYAVNMDDSYIYVQFSQGQAYLYQVVPRQNHGLRGEEPGV